AGQPATAPAQEGGGQQPPEQAEIDKIPDPSTEEKPPETNGPAPPDIPEADAHKPPSSSEMSAAGSVTPPTGAPNPAPAAEASGGDQVSQPPPEAEPPAPKTSGNAGG